MDVRDVQRSGLNRTGLDRRLWYDPQFIENPDSGFSVRTGGPEFLIF